MIENKLLGHGVWGLGWGVGWGKTPKPPPRVGLGWGVALGAWVSSRAWGGLVSDMAGSQWPNQTSRWPTAMLKKNYFFTIKLTFFFHFLPHSTTSSIHLQFSFYKTKKCILITMLMTRVTRLQSKKIILAHHPIVQCLVHFLLHSSMPDMTGYASYLGNRLFTNFTHR